MNDSGRETADRKWIMAGAKHLGKHLYLDQPPTVVTRILGAASVEIALLEDAFPAARDSSPIATDEAIVIGVQMRDRCAFQVRECGQVAPRVDLRTGDAVFQDLRRDPIVTLGQPFREVAFYIPFAAFDAIADDARAQRIDGLAYVAGQRISDTRVMNLAMSLLPELSTPDQACRLFVGHVTLALATHVAVAYGGLVPDGRPIKGGLAPWQVRRATEMMGEDLAGSPSLDDIARECGLSVSHFSRAFRQSLGHPPHSWLVRRRVDAAKSLMKGSTVALSEIALACGFADQSHFTRAFSRATGTSPGLWRRCLSV